MSDFSFTEEDLEPIEEEIDETPVPFSSHIAPDMEMEGTLTVKHGIEIAGGFKGDIQSNSNIKVESTGRIKGTMEAHNISLEGEARCNMTARRRLEVLKGGKFVGELDTQPELIVLSEFATFGQNDEVAKQYADQFSRERSAQNAKEQQEKAAQEIPPEDHPEQG